MAHPFLEKAAQHTAQARAINDEFEGKEMPAEAARQMQGHLVKATEYRARVTAEAQLKDTESWISEPQYKHDPTNFGEKTADEFGHGSFMLPNEVKDAKRAAFFDYLRKGDSIKPEHKAALVQDSDGNKLIPEDFAGTIYKGLPNDAVMRSLCYVRPTTKRTVGVGEVIVNQASWGKLELGDSAADGLGSPPADKQTITVWDLNALVKIGVDELDDSDENLEELIRQSLSAVIAEQEDRVFAVGTGDANKQPTGVANSGSGVTRKVTAAAAGTYTSDDIIKLAFAVPQKARTNGVYVGNSAAEQAARLLKGSDGHYLWQESLRDGAPAFLNGHRWHTNDGFASGASPAAGKPLFFGDFKLGYMIADRKQLGVTRLVERYADEGKIGLVFRHRVGGGVLRPNALAFYEV